MRTTGIIVSVYAFLVLMGGLIGYIKAASIPSLIAGIVFGSILFLSAYAIFKKKKTGQYAALILAFILDGFFTYRFAKTLNFMPAGIMSLISLAVIILLALRMRKIAK